MSTGSSFVGSRIWNGKYELIVIYLRHSTPNTEETTTDPSTLHCRYKMNGVSVSSALLVFVMASLLRYQEANVVRRPILSTTISPMRNISNKAVNETKRMRRPCIRDTPLPPSIKGVGKLWSEHKYFLQINANGVVNGTSDISSPYAQLELGSLGNGLFTAKGVISQRYLSMDRHGRLYSRKTSSLENIFKKVPADNGFVAYKNYVYCWYIGLKRNGQTKRGYRVKATQHSAHFLELYKEENTP